MHEFLIVQNSALGALALYSFVREYAKQKNDEKGAELSLIMPVLPLVFNHRSCECLVDVRRITLPRFLTTLSDYRDIPAGLQQRMVDMSSQTLKALNLALALNLISINTDTGDFLPVKYQRNLPDLQYGHNQNVIYAAKVLGNWFSGFTIEEICMSLNITF